jgi:hypothetical protein
MCHDVTGEYHRSTGVAVTHVGAGSESAVLADEAPTNRE